MKKQYIVLFLGALLAPSFAFASWWNPFSWFKNPVVTPTVLTPLPVIESKPPKITNPVPIPKPPVKKTKPKVVIPIQQPTVIQSVPSPVPVIVSTQPEYQPEHIQPTVEEIKTEKATKILKSCTSDMDDISQQILDIKNDYYKQVDAIHKTPEPVEDQNGEVNQAMGEANSKIAKLQNKAAQLDLDCRNKIYNL